MTMKQFNPTTPGLRFVNIVTKDDLTKGKRPEKALTKAKKQKSGRNNMGLVTVRHRGGGHKRRLREIDFKRRKDGVEGKIVAIEYDPNRTARIALVHYTDGVKSYILASKNLKVGQRILSGPAIDIVEGNTMPLNDMPLGSLVHNVELTPGRGGQMVRAAGTFAQLIANEGDYATLRLPSGEMRLIRNTCRATIGQMSNEEHSIESFGKAGRIRWRGIRPTVRGTVMNPCDHPHGGGEGKNKSAGRHPVSPWGVLAKGGKTRKRRKATWMIVAARKRKR
jgi:large subunit ribosomal protein L2